MLAEVAVSSEAQGLLLVSLVVGRNHFLYNSWNVASPGPPGKKKSVHSVSHLLTPFKDRSNILFISSAKISSRCRGNAGVYEFLICESN